MTPIVNECIICNKPLGQESKDLEYRTCADHRTCALCGDLCNPRDIRLSHEYALRDSSEIEITHARCETLRRSRTSAGDTTVITQLDLDRLNTIRLMVDPDMDRSQDTNERTAMLMSERFVHSMTLEQKFYHLHMLEACIAQLSPAIKRDPKAKEMRESLAKVEKQRIKATQEAATSSRPVAKPADDEKEILLAEFMRINDIKERKTALTLWSKRSKAIQALTTCGVPESVAQNAVDADMVKRGELKSPPPTKN